MGHLLTTEGLLPDPEKITAVQNMQAPTEVKAKFLPHPSDVCEPLQPLQTTLNGCGIQNMTWPSTLKQLVTQQHPVLKHYDLNEDVTLQCDASETGLGIALLKNGQPVAFAPQGQQSVYP